MIIKKISEYQARFGKVVRRIVTEPIELSSCEVRERVTAGKDISHLVPSAVKTYIADNHLYV